MLFIQQQPFVAKSPLPERGCRVPAGATLMADCQALLLLMGAAEGGKVHVQASSNVSPLSAAMHLVAA